MICVGLPQPRVLSVEACYSTCFPVLLSVLFSSILDEEIKFESSPEEMPAFCSKCKRALCLRKQVMNLTVGNTDEMFCLDCLGAESDRKAVEVLLTLKGYALNRECFLKQWRRYESVADCPDRGGCFPDQCFSQT